MKHSMRNRVGKRNNRGKRTRKYSNRGMGIEGDHDRYVNSCIHVFFVFCHVIFKVIYKFKHIFFSYNFDIFKYSCCVHVMFYIVSYFNYFFHIISNIIKYNQG